MPFLTQRRWRVVGAIALAVCAVMGLYGRTFDPHVEPRAFAVYWSVFLFSLVTALLTAVLDLRHIRKQYVQDRRSLYEETLDEESFRRSLSDAHRVKQEKSKKDR
jgi:hypothetical protein